MRFDLLDQKAAPDVTANAALMDLLEAKATHAEIDLRVTVLLVIDHRAMVKVVDRETEKVGPREKAKVDLLKDVDEAKALRDRGLRAVQWDRRILSVSWRTRCVSMQTPMAN